MAEKSKSNRILTGILIGGLLVLIVVIAITPRPVDWSLSFSRRHDTPMGTRLVYRMLPQLFPNQDIIVSHSRLIDFLREATPINSNFIFINESLEFDQSETERLLEIVSAGNNIFLATSAVSEEMADTLNLGILKSSTPILSKGSDSIGYHFTNRRLKSAYGYWYRKAATSNRITSYDTLRTTVLGHDHLGNTNFIRMAFGNGFLYLNSNPIAFTNYHLLSGSNSEYIFKSLSYLPVTSTVWDENYKIGTPLIDSEMTFVLSRPALRMAWYVLFVGILLVFIFQGKRRQRIIPIVSKPVNTSLSFIETIGRLYFSRQNHHDIASKRFVYFLEYLRSHYYLDTSIPESRLIEEAARKSGVPERAIAAIFKMAGNLERVNKISQEDLQQFNRQIDFFYRNCR